MRVVINIDDSIKDPRVVAMAARGLLLQVVAINRILIRQAEKAGAPFPSLIRSDVTWKAEPWKGRVEEFANIKTIFERKWGDCDDFVAAYCAQRAEKALKEGRREKWTPKVYWRQQPKGVLYHAQIRCPDKRVLDPSRLLGM